ncbi:hypothetical protein PQX77_004702 [Marasmius sp. AFHP31]|nr:hypothetical protein PQX77_004702 [Marasmius sp. AFHP31]
MNAHKNDIENFCKSQGCNAETRRKAVEYLHTVRTKEARLKSVNAMVPGCAYLASQRLQTNEITLDVAIRKSCLKRAEFEKELETIRSLLPDDTSPKRRERRMREYDDLIRKYRLSVSRMSLDRWFGEVESEVSSAGRRKIDVGSVLGRCAIFLWLYNVTQEEPLNQRDFVADNDLDSGNFKTIFSSIQHQCRNLEKKISLESERPPEPPAPFQLPVTTPKTSTRKRPLRELPSRDIKRPKIVELEPVGMNTPTQTRSQTTASTDVEMLPPPFPTKTPSRRPGPFGENPTPSSSRQQLSDIRANATGSASPTRRPQVLLETPRAEPVTPSRRKSTRVDAAIPESPSRISRTPHQTRSEDVMDVDSPSSEDEEDVEDMPLPRRYRPVFRDRDQWNAWDPQLKSDCKRGKTLIQKRIELYGNPFEAS